MIFYRTDCADMALSEADIIAIDMDGKPLDGNVPPPLEFHLHAEIYRARPDVQCVLHTHPPYAVALSSSGRPIRVYSQPAALFYESLGVYTDTINLIRSAEMGAGVARALASHRAVLLKNHGVVVTGATIAETVVGAIMLENAAQVQMITEAAGDPAAEFSRADVEKLKHDISRQEQFGINFDYLVRRVKRREAGR